MLVNVYLFENLSSKNNRVSDSHQLGTELV